MSFPVNGPGRCKECGVVIGTKHMNGCRYSTFKGMFRRGVDHAYAHGFRVPIFTSLTDAWRSALGQALAGGWARYTGNDNSHWSASFGRGC